MDRFLGAALGYVAVAWKIFPLAPRGKLPAIPKDQGGHGVLDATCDETTIRQWWSRWPGANIGLACGLSGLVVIDVYADHGGWETWRALRAAHGITGDTLKSITGGGGAHFLYLAPAGLDVRNSAGKLGPGVDVRANGGYIVAPPSIHPNGKPYVFDDTCPDPAPLPDALAELLKGPERPAPALPDVRRGNAGGPGHRVALRRQGSCRASWPQCAARSPGTRNATLNRAVFSLGQLLAGGALNCGRWPLEDGSCWPRRWPVGYRRKRRARPSRAGWTRARSLAERAGATGADSTGRGRTPAWLGDDDLGATFTPHRRRTRRRHPR